MQGGDQYGYGMPDESDAAKQGYLIAEIPDGQHQQAFADYLKQQRPDLEYIDVAFFTMMELQGYVADFKNGGAPQQQYDAQAQGYYDNTQNVQGADQTDQQVMLDADNIQQIEEPAAAQQPASEPPGGFVQVDASANPKDELGELKSRMLALAAGDKPRQIQMQALQMHQRMFAGKKCTGSVSNPQIITESGFLSSSYFLQYDINVGGDMHSAVSRRDHEFTDMHRYLTVKYPNVLVPCLEKNKQVKKGQNEYIHLERPRQLNRFLSYALANETIKSDPLFEVFLDAGDREEFVKAYNKSNKKLTEVQHLSAMTNLAGEQAAPVKTPDPHRVRKAMDLQNKMKANLRLYSNVQQRLTANFKRLEADLRQTGGTMTAIRESIKAMQRIEETMMTDFGDDQRNMLGYLDELDIYFRDWKDGLEKQQHALENLTAGCLQYRADEQTVIMQKLDYVCDFMTQASKQEEKLKAKRAKYNVPDSLGKWENAELSQTFSDEQIRRVLGNDKAAAERLILPKVHQEIADIRLMSAYLTESLLAEIMRVKRTVAVEDLKQATAKFNAQVVQNLQDSLQNASARKFAAVAAQ